MSGEYLISRHSDGWVIAVDGSMLLVCERKKAAMRAVREATTRGFGLLHPDCQRCHAEPEESVADRAQAVAGASSG